MAQYRNALEALIYDCGGFSPVARALNLKTPSVWEWGLRGRLPYSDLTGATDYATIMADMQQTGTLTPIEIRMIGLPGLQPKKKSAA